MCSCYRYGTMGNSNFRGSVWWRRGSLNCNRSPQVPCLRLGEVRIDILPHLLGHLEPLPTNWVFDILETAKVFDPSWSSGECTSGRLVLCLKSPRNRGYELHRTVPGYSLSFILNSRGRVIQNFVFTSDEEMWPKHTYFIISLHANYV